jgi:hypothetical protein
MSSETINGSERKQKDATLAEHGIARRIRRGIFSAVYGWPSSLASRSELPWCFTLPRSQFLNCVRIARNDALVSVTLGELKGLAKSTPSLDWSASAENLPKGVIPGCLIGGLVSVSPRFPIEVFGNDGLFILSFSQREE